MVHLRLRAVLAVLLLAMVGNTSRAAVPAGYVDAEVVDNLGDPTAIAFTPDGRMLVTLKSGQLRVFAADGTPLGTALTIPATALCTNSERGLLGVAVHPDFATNHYVYLFYTRPAVPGQCPVNNATPHPLNHVRRYVLPNDNVIVGAGTVIVDQIPSPAGNHNAGDLTFGPDGHLYISTGDGGSTPATSQQLNNLNGKILRVGDDPDETPLDNPVWTQPNGQPLFGEKCWQNGSTLSDSYCGEIWAAGFRNPFRIAVDPNSQAVRLFANDVGQNTWEEIDHVERRGNYGWNLCEGNHNNGSTTAGCSNLAAYHPTTAPQGHRPPIFEWRHGLSVPGTTSPTNCNSITGAAFVPNGLWADSVGNAFDGDYFFGDSVCGIIGRLSFDGASWTAHDFGSGLGAVIHLEFGPYADGEALYYVTFASGGQVRRISQGDPDDNDPPVAAIDATPTSGPSPLQVAFDGSGSSDPDPGDTLTYLWDFGDGTPVVATATATTNHTYTTGGEYTAQLRVRDQDFAFSAPVTVEIQPDNTPPVLTIAAPAASYEFAAGEGVLLQGSATDAQDGPLPASALQWQVLLNHNGDHTHPVFQGSGTNLWFDAPLPEDIPAAANSFLEIHVSATDSQGLTGTAERDLQPDKVTLTLESHPTGLEVLVFGSPVTLPYSFTSWRNWLIPLRAEHQELGGDLWIFRRWGTNVVSPSVEIITPATDYTQDVYFVLSVDSGPTYFHTVEPCRAVDTRLADGPYGGPWISLVSPRTFVIPGERCGVPADALGIAANVTVVGPTGSGNLALYPAGDDGSATSVLNFVPTRNRANNVVLRPGTGGGVVAEMRNASAHLVIDVVGYFVAPPPED